MKVGGDDEGGRNIFAQLAHAGHIRHFSADATGIFPNSSSDLRTCLGHFCIIKIGNACQNLKKQGVGGLYSGVALALMC